jgi:pyruvate dehydrogenase E2 component (dihydrolipoamide acetyltransferase)
MATVIDMPKLSDTMSVGTLVSWLKNEGDLIEPGDLIAEVETDKATMELEAFDEGILLKQVASAGDEIPIGGAVAVIGEKGETVDLAALGIGTKASAKEEVVEKKASPEVEAAPQTTVVEGVAKATEVKAAPISNDRIKASPLARKLAEKSGIDLSTIEGTGPGGRIVKADVESSAAGVAAPPVTASRSTSAPVSFPVTGSTSSIAKEGKIPLSNMRKVIAQRLMESKSQIPHFYLETNVDVGPLMQLRSDLNNHLGQLSPEQGGMKLTVTDFILKATTEALRRVPQVNTSFGGDHLIQHGGVHMGVAVAVDDGLLVPVIRDAHTKGVRQISAELKEIAARAKNKKLKPNEMTGSTFTVSSLGMFPITGFFGIINQPNAGILSVGTAVKQPVVDANDQIVVGQRMTIGGSFDHRVVDGAVGALFLKALKEIIETPALILL